MSNLLNEEKVDRDECPSGTTTWQDYTEIRHWKRLKRRLFCKEKLALNKPVFQAGPLVFYIDVSKQGMESKFTELNLH